MTLTFQLDLEMVKMNQHAKCLAQRSFSSKVIIVSTLTFQLDLEMVKVNQHAKCLAQRSFSSKVIIVRTYTGPTALPGPLKLSVNI